MVHGQVRQVGSHFRFSHVGRVSFLVEEDEAPDPADVGLFGARAVVTESEGVANLVQEFDWTRRVGFHTP